MLDQSHHGLHVADPGHVAQRNWTVGQQGRGEDRQRGVLVARRTNGAVQGTASGDHESRRHGENLISDWPARQAASSVIIPTMIQSWVGPTVAISLLVIAIACVAIALGAMRAAQKASQEMAE